MFKALMLTQQDKTTHAAFVDLEESALPPGDVRVRVEYSSLNYKDALAVTGRGAIVRSWPMVPGIDLAGVVEHSSDPAWQPGDRVVVNGWGLGETAWGGLAQKASLKSGWLLRLPEGYTTRASMAVATAGYTAALCVMALLRHGTKPEDGEVLVTGATGGVGSVAVALLAGLGFQVTASTGRPQEADYLTRMGAAHIVDRSTLATPGKPLQSERWVAAVDTVGSQPLANALAQTKWNGAVAACGLAGGADLPSTVMPFILRGVTLYGINCVFQPNSVREQAWALLARHVKPGQLAEMTHEVALSDIVQASNELLAGRIRGRTVVDVNR